MDWNQSTMYEQRVLFILEVSNAASVSPSPVGVTASAGPPDTRGGIVSWLRDSRASMDDLTDPITARTP